MTTQVDEAAVADLLPLIRTLFGADEVPKFLARLSAQTEVLLLTARLNGQVVGFKIGYALEQNVFYSWLGGVAQDHRRSGIARRLMQRQHEWCLDHNFHTVRTKTQNHFREMLLLNIREGFDVIRTYLSESHGHKIVLEKRLK